MNVTELHRFFYERRARRFLPAFFSSGLSSPYVTTGCGPAALAVLTGVHPAAITAFCRKQLAGTQTIGTPFSVMNMFLTQTGFEVTEITEALTTPSPMHIVDNLTADHCLLVDVTMTSVDRSWIVVWGDYEFHNMSIRRRNFMDTYNHKVNNKYLVWHPDWKISQLTQEFVHPSMETLCDSSELSGLRRIRLRRRISTLCAEVAALKGDGQLLTGGKEEAEKLKRAELLTGESLDALENALIAAMQELSGLSSAELSASLS